MSKLIGALMCKNDSKVLPYNLERLSEFCDSIIVLDDGSSDNSLEIIKSFEKVSKIITHPVGQKFDNALNLNEIFMEIRKINPEWVMILDPDDLVDKRFVEQKDQLLSKKNVGQYKFQEISLWSGKKYFRADKPDWYMRDSAYSPILFRWNDNIHFAIAQETKWKSKVLKKLSGNTLLGVVKKTLPFKKKSIKINWIKQILYPSDYMSYTNGRIVGIEGETIQLDLKKIHYHFFDWEYAVSKHINYALQAAIRQNRTLEEIPEIVEWATQKLNEDGLTLKPVKKEWGVL